jgi:two-component system, OmpR family, alkaline phosphatase synthesis response regulator PhoP
MRKKVLIVDDNEELLGLLRLSFRAAGFSIATATNGIEALRKARSVAPDLILLDLVLPELDGFAVCETLRRAPATSSIPIYILSGLTSEFTRLAGIESGATAYFPKPISPKNLVSRIKESFGNLSSTAHIAKLARRSHSPRCAAARTE